MNSKSITTDAVSIDSLLQNAAAGLSNQFDPESTWFYKYDDSLVTLVATMLQQKIDATRRCLKACQSLINGVYDCEYLAPVGALPLIKTEGIKLIKEHYSINTQPAPVKPAQLYLLSFYDHSGRSESVFTFRSNQQYEDEYKQETLPSEIIEALELEIDPEMEQKFVIRPIADPTVLVTPKKSSDA